jgi:hypothetical protein
MWRMSTNNPSLVVGRVDTPAPIVASTGLLIKSIVFADAGGGQLIDATGAVLPIGGASGMVNPPVADNVTDIGTAPLRFRTLFLGTSLVTPTIGVSPLVQHTLPAVFSGEVLTDNAYQSLVNKWLNGTSNYAYNYSAVNNQPVSMFGFQVLGANGVGPGAAGLAARVPFNASDDSGNALTAGAIEGGWIDVTSSIEQGYTALCGSYAGTVYPTVRAVIPPAFANYTNGLSVMGAITGSNPSLIPFGGGANLGLDFQAVGAGIHRFYGATEFSVTDDGTPSGGISINVNVAHQLTIAPAVTGMGAAHHYSIRDSLGVDSDLGYIGATIVDNTPGSIQGRIELRPVDGISGPTSAGFVVAPTGIAAARVRGVQLIPGATGVNAVLLGIGEAGAGLDLRADPTGSASDRAIRIRNPGDTATMLAIQPLASGLSTLTMQSDVDLGAAPTLDSLVGQAAIQIGDTTLVVTNAHVTAASVVLCVLQSVNATFTTIRSVVPAAGSFTVTGNNAATVAVAQIGFMVVNPST